MRADDEEKRRPLPKMTWAYLLSILITSAGATPVFTFIVDNFNLLISDNPPPDDFCQNLP